MSDTNEPQPSGESQRKSGFAIEVKEDGQMVSKVSEPNDTKTDQAVDDIMKHDGDEALQQQDEVAAKAIVMKQHWWEKIRDFNNAWWSNRRRRWGTIILLLVLIGGGLAVPYTRYNVLGLVMTAPVTVTVLDDKSAQPVSGAAVEIGGKKAQTDGEGKATLKVNAGTKTLKVSKAYYQGYAHSELVALGKNKFKATVTAQGRPVKIKVVNKISGKPVTGAEIKAGSAIAKTDKNGLATLVTPSSDDKQAATISLSGFNSLKVEVHASGDLTKNTFSVVPAGKLYFLSNLSGKIDVVKTNLDGTDRQTVLAGTGSEDRYSTSLLASRDWKYLALLSKRSGDKASVYLIDTTQNDKLTTIDQGNAAFTFVGWSGNSFVYKVERNNVQLWQPNKTALKAFDATTGKTTLLDQTQGQGTSDIDYWQQYYSSVYLVDDQVVYTKNWNIYFITTTVADDKKAEIDSIGVDGSGHKILKSFALGHTVSGQDGNVGATAGGPKELYFLFSFRGDNSFFEYDDGNFAADSSMTIAKFTQTEYPTYLQSPSGKSTFWADPRDGKNLLFVGDADAKGQKQIASLSEYSTYGWFTDDYLLVSKNSSELYIMGKDGGTPQKITDYYKPYINYQGYGGGYGGL